MKTSRWLLLIMVLALSCDEKPVDPNEPGELTVQVIWEDEPVATAKIAEAPAGVVTMRFTIQPGDIHLECPASKGRMDSPILEPGVYNLSAKGLDNRRIVTHSGFVSNIRVLSGKPTVVTVTLDRKHEDITVDLPGGATMEMVWIEPGTFTMGSSSDSGRFDDEGPQHEVMIANGFWLGRFELTQEQWKAVMGTTPWSGKDRVQGNSNNPAVYISWNDIQEFIAKLNETGTGVYRLPTEAEWEYSCRTGTTTQWSFGDTEDQLRHYAWFSVNYAAHAMEVGTKLPNPWGLHDMHGNVWEWAQDWYGSYSSSSQTDPTGPATGSNRVIRGGYFYLSARYLRSAHRGSVSSGLRGDGIGARLLRQSH